MEQKSTAIITGGSEGIGYACAAALLQRNYKLCLISRNADKLEEAKKELLRQGNGTILTIPADVRKKPEVEAAGAAAFKQFGRIDVLINSAGCSMRAPASFESVTQEEYERIIRTNLDGTFYMTQAALALMKQRNSGFIVNILSTAAVRAGAGNGPYSASKFAARALTETLVEECRGSGIRISSISPGPVETTIWTHKITPPLQEKKDKMLRPADIADLAVFLIERPPYVHIRDMEVTPWYYNTSPAAS
jgi:NADP-dependent 3-hydroxy acid dehydrogenase YdfG